MGKFGKRLPSHTTVAAYLGLFAALATGGAYAADEWTGDNIQDGTLDTRDYKNNDIRSVDVRDDTFNGGGLTSADLARGAVGPVDIAPNAVGTFTVEDGSLRGSDIGTGEVASVDVLDETLRSQDIGLDAVGAGEIAAEAVGASEIAFGSVGTSDVQNGSLTGDDVDEFRLGPTEKPYVARASRVEIPGSGALQPLVTKAVPPGNYLVIGRVEIVNNSTGADTDSAKCVVTHNRTVIDTISGDWLAPLADVGAFEVYSFLAWSHSDDAGEISLGCSDELPGTDFLDAFSPRLAAIRLQTWQ